MISALFLIAGIHSTTTLKTHEHAKISLIQQIQSSSEEALETSYIYRYMFPFYVVQYANTEFMS